jgi:cbb3-type cytochrome oxidase subunit 3
VASNTLDITTAIVMLVLLGVVVWAISRSKRPAQYALDA